MSVPISTKTPFDADQILARSRLYHIAACLFRHPLSQKETVCVEKDMADGEAAVDVLPSFYPRDIFRIPLRRLGQEIRTISPEAWARQYEACFGHTACGPVPCYEMEYGEEHSHRQPQQLADIAAFYLAFGLKIYAPVCERADHIAVECEFMQYLLFKEAYALANDAPENALICRQASERFLKEHLGRWAPSFARKLFRHAPGDLLKAAADFTLAFISWDCQAQGTPPGAQNLPVRRLQTREDPGCAGCMPGPPGPAACEG